MCRLRSASPTIGIAGSIEAHLDQRVDVMNDYITKVSGALRLLDVQTRWWHRRRLANMTRAGADLQLTPEECAMVIAGTGFVGNLPRQNWRTLTTVRTWLRSGAINADKDIVYTATVVLLPPDDAAQGLEQILICAD